MQVNESEWTEKNTTWKLTKTIHRVSVSPKITRFPEREREREPANVWRDDDWLWEASAVCVRVRIFPFASDKRYDKWKLGRVPFYERALSARTDTRFGSLSLWCGRTLCMWVCVVFSPCILLQPIRTYDYYQFVIIVAGAVVVVAVIHWFIYFNCTFAMLYRFLACSMHAQLMARTNRNSGRYASPFDHLSVIHYFPLFYAHFRFTFNEGRTHSNFGTVRKCSPNRLSLLLDVE